MARPKLTLYLDIISPFVHLAFFYLERQKGKIFKGVDITYVPVFLGGIMKATNNQPPINIKNKGEWINKERLRLSKRYNIPVAEQAPDGFPLNTINVQRALCVISTDYPDKLAPAVAALFQAIWVERKQIHQKDVYGPVLEKVLGAKDAATVFEKAGSAENKDLLQKNTTQAIQDGAFGLPFFVATNAQGKKEVFWGFDRIGLVQEFLGLEVQDRASL